MKLSPLDKLNFNTKYDSYDTITIDKKQEHHRSASLTDIWFCTLSNETQSQKVVIKFSYINDDDVVNYDSKNRSVSSYEHLYGLKYETQVYDYVQRNIIDSSECFNFVGYVGCLNHESDNVKEFLKSSKLCVENKTSLYTVLITEDNDTITLNDILELKLISLITEDIIIEIFTQIFYTLIVMEKHCLFHGDLHPENIRIKMNDTSQKMCFNVDGEIFTIMSRYVVQIYDWDRGYCDNLGINPQSVYYRFIPKEDLRRIIISSSVYHQVNNIFKLEIGFYNGYKSTDQEFKDSEDVVRVRDNNGDIVELKMDDVEYDILNFSGIIEIQKSNVIKMTDEMNDRFLNVVKHMSIADEKRRRYLLTKRELDEIFIENPFVGYDHCYLRYRNDTIQPIFGAQDESNVRTDLKTPMELFKEYAVEVKNCESDYSVSTVLKPFTLPPTPILLSFEEINELIEPCEDYITKYYAYITAMMIAKLTDNFELAKEMMLFSMHLNFDISGELPPINYTTIFHYPLKLKIYNSEELSDFFDSEMNAEKFLEGVNRYNLLIHERETVN